MESRKDKHIVKKTDRSTWKKNPIGYNILILSEHSRSVIVGVGGRERKKKNRETKKREVLSLQTITQMKETFPHNPPVDLQQVLYCRQLISQLCLKQVSLFQ